MEKEMERKEKEKEMEKEMERKEKEMEMGMEMEKEKGMENQENCKQYQSHPRTYIDLLILRKHLVNLRYHTCKIQCNRNW
jgi:hypothetical protein